MATRAQVMHRVKQLGATIDIRADRGTRFRSQLHHEIVIEAPVGHVWSGTDVHERVLVAETNAPLASLYPLAMDDMAAGVEPCTDEGCEWCEALHA